jgi:hypothetical protein
MHRMSSDLLFDYARLLAQFSGDECEVNLFHRARGELFGQFPVGDIIFGHHETAACFLVEAMNNTRPLFSADPGQRGAVTEQRVDQSVFALTWARVNGKASRFIDNDEIVVFEKYIEWNRLWPDIDLLYWWLNQINFVTRSDNLPRSDGLLVDPNESAADQLLKA